VQLRIGILNQLTAEAITEIVSRFTDAVIKAGAEIDKPAVLQVLQDYYSA